MEPNTIKIDEVEYVRKDSTPKAALPYQLVEVFPYEIGRNYFIRTVTHYYTGRLIWVGDKELLLENVSWVADTGRFSNALKQGVFNEVEPYPKGRVIIGRGSIIDASIWNSNIVMEQR
jgi:hypothetical protein